MNAAGFAGKRLAKSRNCVMSKSAVALASHLTTWHTDRTVVRVSAIFAADGLLAIAPQGGSVSIRHSGFAATMIVSVVFLMASCGGGAGSTDNPKPVTPTPVVPVVVASVTVVLSAPSAIVGQTVQATATTRDAAGNVLTGRTVAWSSASTSIATVRTAGLVTAVSPGSTQITATSEGVVATATFTAVSLASLVDSVVLALDSTEMIIGDTVRIVAVPRDAAGHAVAGITLTFASSNSSVASVSQTGLVTSRDFGEAVIDVFVATSAMSASVLSSTLASQSHSTARGTSRMRIYSAPKVVLSPLDRTIDAPSSVSFTARLTDTKGALLTSDYHVDGDRATRVLQVSMPMGRLQVSRKEQLLSPPRCSRASRTSSHP